MKRKLTALLLALALALSLCAGAVLADETPKEEAPAAGTADGPGEDGAEAPEAPEDAETPSPAGPDPADTPAEAYVPDAVGTISFANLERRMRENNLNVLMLQENIDAIEETDYDRMYEDLRTSLNGIAKGQWAMIEASNLPSEHPYYHPLDYTYGQLEQAYGAMREQFDAIKKGELQEDNAGLVRQLKNAQDQVLMGGESLYVAIASLQYQEAALQRQLAATNRTVEELELRYQLGQVSALQLQEAKAGRTTLVSGLSTLQMNLETLKTQLELLIGGELTGAISLGAVPEVTAAQLEQMDLEQNLAAAKEISYELYAANETLKDAKEDYIDSLSAAVYLRDAGKHTWQAAQYTYNAAVQDYELRFRTLYAQVGDYKQIWEAAKVSLASQQEHFAASQLKYDQGTLSKNALLTAENDLRAAEDAVQTAGIDLFSAYNTYCWAVQHGILN